MKIIIVIGIFILSHLVQLNAKVCPSSFNLQSDVCIQINTDTKKWTDARSWCRWIGADLISLKTESMFQYLRSYTSNQKRNLWLGCSDSNHEGRFVWVDGSTYISKNWWLPGEPNDSGTEDCIEMYNKGSVGLNDEDCGDEERFVCERAGCQDINHCQKGQQVCITPTDNTCRVCDFNKIFFKLTHSDTKCEQMCSFNSHYCWPGTCGNELTRQCSCADNFHKVASSSQTSCQLKEDNKPSIDTCDTVTVGVNGEKKRAMSSSNSTACEYLQPFYGNFQPVTVSSDVMVEFTINENSFLPYPRFIKESKFGITDVTVSLRKLDINEHVLDTDERHLKQDTSKSTQVERTFSQKDFNYTVPPKLSLSNGQRLCTRYDAKGGGYLKPYKFDTNSILSSVPYQKTTKTKDVCYIFDNAPPEHCLATGTCQTEPLVVSERVTRSPIVTVTFDKWSDPLPTETNPSSASGIESYHISVHEVLTTSVPLQRDLKNVLTKTVDSSVTTMVLNLTTDRPKLFCIILEVKDVADNVRQTRRFVLYDNSSMIRTDSSKQFYVNSASSNAGYLWQTHHNQMCLKWTDYFLNQIYLNNPFLSQIKPEDHGLITGAYEQTTGQIPVNGTQNVHGIIKYEVSWARNNGNMSQLSAVPDFTNQSYCYNVIVDDGETYTLTVKATDIAGNTKQENRTVHIDRTAPHINNIWLIKDGYKRLFVHDSTDLSEMELYFETLDPHSGIKIIEWTFGTSDAGVELTKGNSKVNRINGTTCPDGAPNCYCPNVGECEVVSYIIPMQKLVAENVHKGDHNRNYYFTIKVTNQAMLYNIEHLDILVDDSPPETGVVVEGPTGGTDIDYMSDDNLNVRWHGFVDHESGIKLYRVAVARTCLTKEDFINSTTPDNADLFQEVSFPINAVTFPANFTGKMFTTVVAINNAMDISEAVCSDGITKDNNPPAFRNVTLQNGRWSESVVCHQGDAWLMESSLSKIRLHQTHACALKCSNTTNVHKMAEILPEHGRIWKDSDVSEYMCQTKKNFITEEIVYLPHDKIYLKWDLEDSLSQVDDFYVGIGADADDSVAPTIVNYQSTKRHQLFKRQHIGIGSDELFYIFLKAKSKAGLETVIPLGPILIDETPPEYKEEPSIHVDDEFVSIAWDNDTFYDKEQTEPIDTVYFQFGHDSLIVTPMMEWVKNVSSPCGGYSGGCIHYPVKRLQRKDKEQGLYFFVEMYFYNKAGHYSVYKSDVFQVPSIYPPGQGRVLDVDPDHQLEDDVDVHTKSHTICVKWEGFRHHENMQFEFAVGTTPGSSDVYAFTGITNLTSHCETSSIFSSGIYYYASIRANCTGGTALSSSNGVRILPKDFLESTLKVSIGNDCKQSMPVIEENMMMDTTTSFIAPLKVGRQYLALTSEKYTDLIINEGVIKKEASNVLNIISFVDQPDISINCDSVCNLTMKIFECPSTTLIKPSSNVSISIAYQLLSLPVIDYKLTLIHDGLNETIHFMAQNTLHEGNVTYLTLESSYFSPGHSYRIALQPCFHKHCMKAFVSNTFTIEKDRPKGNITVAELRKDTNRECYDIHASWTRSPFSGGILFHQWSVSGDVGSRQLMTKWHTLNDSDTDIKINECINIAAHLHKSLFFCVRAFSEAGTEGLTCRKLDVLTLGEYDKDTVYDFDSNSADWNKIKQILHAKSIGTSSAVLHNAELDFATPSSQMVGAIAYGSGRNISWHLAESKNLPDPCNEANGCKYIGTNTDGYVHLPMNILSLNKIYYICLFANATETTREYFTESLEEIEQCSNGFIVDDQPPSAGKVSVFNKNGYITDLNDVTVHWTEFTDNIDATQLGYPNPIQFYSYGVGSRPGGDDIKQFTSVDLSRMAIAEGLHVADGSAIYISVKGTDHAGLSSVAISGEVIVDTTPPSSGIVMLHCGYGRSIVCSSSTITLHLANFDDEESGIESFDVAVGSSCGMANIVEDTYTSSHIVVDLGVEHDGHAYCITVKARNRAGLTSPTVTQEFILDTSPPNGGQILDGAQENTGDLDYQTEITSISSHWTGFTDAHCGLDYYRVGLGLQPYEDDVEAMTNVGLRTEITWNSSFVVGERYYTVVEACNKAGLCTVLTSDGLVLDNSPPIQGIIHIGSEEGHQKYIQTRSSVHVRWFGFEDPQSDIEHFELCVGSSPGTCDVLPFFNCLLQSNIIKTGLNLTGEKNYYATVRAYNKVRLLSSSISDAFKVDSSPPNVIALPTFRNVQENVDAGHFTTWEKSVLTITWQFDDQESPITHHVVTLKTHHDGHTSVELQKVGNVDQLTLQLDQEKWLSNGDKYIAVVTACNAAGHCTSAESAEIFVDSLPPHLGGFKPPLTWQNFQTNTSTLSNVMLTWYGFHDEESELKQYFVTVSRSYSGDELSDGVIIVPANESHSNGLTEQTANITLTEALSPNDLIILTIWASNEAGLNSSIGKVSVNCLSSTDTTSPVSDLGGLLELQKHSCDVHYCNKDCTCAVVGLPCVETITNASCVNLNSSRISSDTPNIQVVGGLGDTNQTITASSACLTAHWHTDHLNDMVHIKRFEWSMGLDKQPVGEGIFDLKREIPWKDVGTHNEIIHCLPNNSLIHDEDYRIYVKVWYSDVLSRVFKSDPVRIDQSAPSVRRGAYVSDSDSSCKKDYDYIDWMDTITGCWDRVFSEDQGHITHYDFAIGTSPGADDVYPSMNVGLIQHKQINNATFHHGTKYYITVTAYNNIGLHTSTSSDGFVIDMDTPYNGVVFNTDRHHDTLYQSTSNQFFISWHGFQDHFSGIRYYSVALVDDVNQNWNDTQYVNVGLRNHHTFKNRKLAHGSTYYGVVKAYDAAGHVSNMSISKGKLIDTTPPVGVLCTDIVDENMTEIFNISSTINTPYGYNFSTGVSYILRGKLSTFLRRVTILIGSKEVSFPVQILHNETFYFEHAFISEISGYGEVSLHSDHRNVTAEFTLGPCQGMETMDESAVRIKQFGTNGFLVNVLVKDDQSSIYKVQLGLGTTFKGFQVRPLLPIHWRDGEIVHVDLHHGTKLYFTVIAENHAGLRSVFHGKPVTLDKTPPTVVERPVLVMNEAENTTMDIDVTWVVKDEETGVSTCQCALGHHKGSADIRPYQPAISTSTCSFDNVVATHGDTLVGSVRCVNDVELVMEMTSEPFIVSIDTPKDEFASVDVISMDKTIVTADPAVDASSDVVQANRTYLQVEWRGFSDISGIDGYECRLLHDGKVQKPWTSSGIQTMAAMRELSLISGEVYTTEVRAVNTGHHHSDPVSADVLVLSSTPTLTGHPVKIKHIEGALHLDWGNVFKAEKNAACVYDVVVGSHSGYNDLIDKRGVTTTGMDLTLEATMLSPNLKEIFLTLTCNYVTGAFGTYRMQYPLV